MINDPNNLYPPVQHPNRNTFPLGLIIGGVILQLYASGFAGVPNQDFLNRAWAVLVVAAGIDFFLIQKRFLSGSALTVLGGILLILNFGGESVEPLRALFIRFWPLLLIAYGVDIFLRSQVVGAVVSFVFVGGAILIAILVANGILTLPNVALPKTLTAGNFSTGFSVPGGRRTLSYPYPDQQAAKLTIHAPSGKLDLRGGALAGEALAGTVSVSAGETFSEESDGSGAVAAYALVGKKDGSGNLEFGQPQQTDAVWEIRVNEELPLTLETTMESGYQLINLSRMALSSASITSLDGKIDVLLPYQAIGGVTLSCRNGDLRIFIPRGVSAFLTVPANASVTFPSNYVRTGNQIYPNSDLVAVSTEYQVNVSAAAPNGSITVAVSEN